MRDSGIEELETRLDLYNHKDNGVITTEIEFQNYGKIKISIARIGYFNDMESAGCRTELRVELPITASGVDCNNIVELLSRIEDGKLIAIEGPLQEPERYRAFLVGNLPARPSPPALAD